MILNLNEIKFLKDLYCVKYLNTSRILKLFKKNNVVYIRRRLKMLADNKYVKVFAKLPSRENIYCIDKKGLEYLGYKPNKNTSGIEYSLAFSDFYFHTKPKNVFIKFNNHYFFNFNKRKYILNIDILFRSNTWAFVEFDLDNRPLENIFKKIKFYYESNEYTKLFDKFPILLIITNNIELTKFKILKTINNNINVNYKIYEELKDWNYNY